MIDRRNFKFIRFLRIMAFILISVMLILLSIASYFVLKDLIFIPIIMSIFFVVINVLFIFLLLIIPERIKDIKYNLNDNILSFLGNTVDLNDVISLSVYSFKNNVYKIKLKTSLDTISINKLENDGLNIIISKILEVKNGKDI